MESNRLKELHRRIDEAELVLVGIGEAFQYDWGALTEEARYREIEEEIAGREDYSWIVSFLQKMVLLQKREDQWRCAYHNLKSLLASKNYFVISLCMDDYIFESGLEAGRIVTPCGGFRRMQCDHNCSHVLSDMPQESYEAVLQYYRKELPLEAMREPICGMCGEKLRFNQLGVTRYAEEGYLDQWNVYTKWLQGTVNKRLCVLELGVGMAYPTVIRFPFEKILFYNQKAYMYRIHPSLYHLGEEIGDRGLSVRENPVDFLCGLI